MRAVHGFAAMSKYELREAFGIAGDLGALCPRVTVRVERYASDAEPEAPPAKFRGAVAGLHAFQIREEGAAFGKVARIASTSAPKRICGG